MTVSRLTPLGCGSYRENNPDFPQDLLSRMEPLDLGPEDLYLAWELARLTGGLTDKNQERALILLVLATRLAFFEGSTRLNLRDGYLERIWEGLGISKDERRAIDELLAAAQSALEGPGNRSSGEDGDFLPGRGILAIFGRPGDYRPLILERNCLYIQKLHVLEARVGKALQERLQEEISPSSAVKGKRSVDPSLETALQGVIANPPRGPSGKIHLDEEQQNAIRSALAGRIAVISGRPGSGKTSIVAGLLRVLARAGSPPLVSITLAAPTGKAADRLRRSITDHLQALPAPQEADRELGNHCPPSLTLHRLLGYSPGEDRFWHSELNPLSEELIIVDESSMIDLAMMDQLLRALRPEARLILLGDADQLPSIGTGAVLRDLCGSQKAARLGRAVVLKKSYRAREEDSSGKKILEAAAAINEGKSPAGAGTGSYKKVKQARELEFAGVEHLDTADLQQLEAFCCSWEEYFLAGLPDLEERLRREYPAGSAGFADETNRDLRIILEHYESFRILCVTRVEAATGVEAINRRFHQRWQKERRGVGNVPVSPGFLIGEPVLATRNDYNLRLFNGDSGLLLMVKQATERGDLSPEPMAVFPRGGGFVAYPPEILRGSLEPAWATTVHKAQGSEYDHVALILPPAPRRPLSRELLYTAVTRARKSVTFVGPAEVLEYGVRRNMERFSGLAEML